MAPKLEAAVTFIQQGGRRAVIADLADGVSALNGQTGTTILGDN
jgi:carbamate kinase